jgi:hypothetical protein
MDGDAYHQGLNPLAGFVAPPKPVDWADVTVGSRIKRKDVHADAVWHYGVKFDPQSVLHIDKEKGTGLVRFRHDNLDGFAAGRQVFLDQAAPDGAVDSRAIHDRALAVRRSGAVFGLFSVGDDWNCEDVANFLGAGEKRSRQADVAAIALAVIAIVYLYLLARKA